MSRPKKIKQPKTLFDKVKEFDENLAVSVYALSEDELKTKLVALADEDDKIEKAKGEDTDLASLREQVKTASETYSIPTKRNKLRRKLVLEVLTERGKL